MKFSINLITFPVSGFCFSEKTDILRKLNFRKQKWLIFCCYNPHKHLRKDYLLQIKNAIDFYSKSYENIIQIGDFNAEISDNHMDSFCAIYHLKSLIKEPTCYKNPNLILINSPRQFKSTLKLETGLSDFHKMTVAAFKSEFPHQKPKMVSYRNYNISIESILKRKLKTRLLYRRSRPKIS